MNGQQDKLVQLTGIERQLAEIQTIDEAKGIRDQAEALRKYAKSAKSGLTIQNRAAKIKILAERRAGQLIAAIPRNTPKGKPKGQGLLTTLRNNEIPIETAHRWQAEAEIPEETIHKLEAEKNESGQELTSREIISLARNGRRVEGTPQKIAIPGYPDAPFRAIVIDPPWPIEKIQFERRPAEKEELDYPTMSLDEIAKLKVPDLANPDGCHIYLWVTHKFLPAGLDLFKTWGVRYECLLTWNKPTAQPLWWRYLTEHCLFGKIGSLAPLKKGCAVSFSAPQQRHSHKPEAFFDLVRTVSPERRLTMFDFDREGFTRWGITHAV